MGDYHYCYYLVPTSRMELYILSSICPLGVCALIFAFYSNIRVKIFKLDILRARSVTVNHTMYDLRKLPIAYRLVISTVFIWKKQHSDLLHNALREFTITKRQLCNKEDFCVSTHQSSDQYLA